MLYIDAMYDSDAARISLLLYVRYMLRHRRYVPLWESPMPEASTLRMAKFGLIRRSCWPLVDDGIVRPSMFLRGRCVSTTGIVHMSLTPGANHVRTVDRICQICDEAPYSVLAVYLVHVDDALFKFDSHSWDSCPRLARGRTGGDWSA